MRAADIDSLSRTIYGEARGEVMLGKIAVAHVVLNRFKRPGWWTRHMGDGIPDDTIQAACHDPWQFSCWNPSDPNLPKMLAVTLDDAHYQDCMYAALACGLGQVPDPTHGSAHYHTLSILPRWAEGRSPACSIGVHKFYNDIP